MILVAMFPPQPGFRSQDKGGGQCEEMICLSTTLVSHRLPALKAPAIFIYTSNEACFFLLRNKFIFPSTNVNLQQKQICQVCLQPTYTSKVV